MQYMEPTSQEIRMRKDLVQRFTKLIASFNMNVSVQPVGSYVTGLYLPTSDIDMVLTCQHGLQDLIPMYGLMERIRKSGFASKVVDVLRASVPLIRITDKITGIEIDLTAKTTEHAIRATEAVQKWLQRSSPAKPLLFVVKMFLLIRRCGTTYTGGINSYVLFWMVVAWVKLEMPKNKTMANSADDIPSLITAFGRLSTSKSSEGVDLGELLVNFLKFYGEEFDYCQKAIDIEPTPAYCTKIYGYSRYGITERYLLSICDPADITIDMGSKAYGIKHIQESFKEAYRSLTQLEAKRKSGQRMGEAGVLGSVLGGDWRILEKRRDAWKSHGIPTC